MRRTRTPPPDLPAPASSQDNPALASLLAQLARAVPTNGQVHVIAVDPRTWNASGLALRDNCIALDGGSSTTTEELMYRHIYGPYFKHVHHHIHLHFLDGSKKYKTFATEEEAWSFIRRNQKRVVAKPISVQNAIGAYVDSRTDVRETTRTTIRFRLEAFASGFEEILLQSFPAMTAWDSVLAKKNAVDTLHGIRSVANGFFRWSIREGYLNKNPLEGIKIKGKKKRGKPQLRLDEARMFLEELSPYSTSTGSPSETAVSRKSAPWVPLPRCCSGSETARSRAARFATSMTAGTCSGSPRARPRLASSGWKSPTFSARTCSSSPATALAPSSSSSGSPGRGCSTGRRSSARKRPHANPHEVAAALGHTSFRVTERHYAQPAAIASARQQAAAETLLAANPSKNPSKTFGQENINATAK
jgi:hypothetical protein